MNAMKALYALTLGLCMVLATGCGSSPVADDLGQREANKLVAVLGEHGIHAEVERGRGSKGRYSVMVWSGDFGGAVALLTKYGLPAERGASFDELMAPSGFLPASQDVENLRMDRALAAEIEELLLGHGGVTTASVIARSYAVPAGAEGSVAIVAQVKKGATFDQDKLRDAVSRVVPGVKPSAIIFSVSEQVVGNGGGVEEPLVPFLKYWKVPASEYNGLSLLLIGLMSFVAFLTGVAGYIYGQYEGAKGGDLPPIAPSTGQLGGRPVPSREEDEEV
jgi:type III secretory pathway lipoprotein EscJ